MNKYEKADLEAIVEAIESIVTTEIQIDGVFDPVGNKEVYLESHSVAEIELLIREHKAKFDMFQQMYRMQKRLQEKIGLNMHTQTQLNLQFIGAITELCEVLEQTAWKPWKESAKTNKPKAVEELVDVFHFVINLMLCLGVTPQQLFELYQKKHEENIRRQNEGY